MTTTLRVKLPVLHPAQRIIIKHPARFKVLACGRRFGKTTIAADVLANDMIDGYPVAYCAPSYKMVQEVWRVMKRILRPVTAYSNETEKRIELITGGSLDMWSLESPDSIRGRKYYRVVIDEAAFVKGLLTIWEKALSPLLTDYQGSALFPSTPQGFNDFWRLYQRELEQVEGWKSFKFPTTANPHIPPEEIELQRRTLPPRSFAQEYEASFEEDAGAVYDNFTSENVTTDAEYNPALQVVWGVDDGYVYGDGPGTATYHPRVILFGQFTSQGGIHIFDEYVQAGELSEVSITNALALPYARPSEAYIDSSAAELTARLWEIGIYTIPATHKVSEGIKNVRRLVRDGQGVCLLKIHPRCRETIREMQTYRYDQNQHGVEPKPLKLDDHTQDCLRYMASKLMY